MGRQPDEQELAERFRDMSDNTLEESFSAARFLMWNSPNRMWEAQERLMELEIERRAIQRYS